MRYYLFAVATLIAAPALSAQSSDNIAAWRQDLQMIATEVPARHPNAFYRLEKASWDSAVRSIDARLPQMSRNQAMVAFMQLVAMVNDGHTSINPFFTGGLEFHQYPIRLFQFEDGLYVKSAAPKYASLAGAKVIRVGNATADRALAAVATTISHENEWFLRSWAPQPLMLAEILDGLGLVTSPDRLTLVVEKNGRQETVTLENAPRLEFRGHDPNAGPVNADWTDMRSSSSEPLWVRRPGVPYWWEYVPEDSTFYVAYRGNVSMDNQTNPQFWRSVFAAADTLPLNRFVIDVRENPGGESFFNRQVVRGIIARPRIDQRGKLFVIMSGHTFSAAMNLVLDLETWTNATLVGEPTGNASVFFGDHRQIKLPVSGLTVNISSLPWYPDDPRDKRAFVAPRIYAPMTAAQYRANVDPAMQAILARATTRSLASRVEHAVLAGDTTGALAAVTGAIGNSENRFFGPEADINTLGYRLLDSNRAAAIAVFRINTRAFPKSANTWDSLGEALIVDGQREAGIAAYRKALELSPGLASAVAALERLH